MSITLLHLILMGLAKRKSSRSRGRLVHAEIVYKKNKMKLRLTAAEAPYFIH